MGKKMKVSLKILFIALASASSSHAFYTPVPSTALLKSFSTSSSTSLALGFNPFNEAKKKLVQALAGDYDKEATQAKLQNLISSNKILMMSFTK